MTAAIPIGGLALVGGAATVGLAILRISTRPVVGQALESDVAALLRGRYADMAERTIKVVAPAVVVVGIVRGTLFSPIRSVDALTTAYGITWIIALVAVIATFLWGLYVIGGAAQVMNAAPLAADGGPTPELERATARVKNESPSWS